MNYLCLLNDNYSVFNMTVSVKKVVTIFVGVMVTAYNLWAQQPNTPYVIVVSLDGFRWDFPDMYPTPHLNAIAAKGVKAKYLIPSFPTKTYPNHYSMVTGLYPDHHGIVANKFLDTKLNLTFTLGSKEKYNPAFYGGNPIWNIAESQGIKTASFYWAGSDLPINGGQPSIWKHYKKGTGLEERIDSVLRWLQLPEAERPHLVTVYLEEPDMAAHEFGPVSPETREKVMMVDSLIGVLERGIQQLPHADKINLIVLSDHGLAEVSRERLVPLEDYIPQQWLAAPTMGSPVVFLKAQPGYYDSIASRLSSIPHVKGYPSKKIPKRLHFGTNARAMDFTLVADKGWSIGTHPPEAVKHGNHGFDNKHKDMRAIFYATGPAFKKHYRQKAFENIHVYALIARLLDIPVPSTDADVRAVRKMLKKGRR